MDIKCTVCGKYCGEIRDAKLIKNLKFICNECNERRLEITDDLHKARQALKFKPKNNISDIFGIFK